MLEDHFLLAVRDCLFIIFTATLHTGGHSSIRNLWTCNAEVTGAHLLWHMHAHNPTIQQMWWSW